MTSMPRTAVEVLAAFATGTFSTSDYVEHLIDAERACRALNAIVAMDPAALRRAARQRDEGRAAGEPCGALHGLPFVAKDNMDTVELPTTACTPALRGNRPPRNAAVVQRLLDAGAILLGKANMHELAFGVTNNHGAFGPARNPYDPACIPGGSSGGTAVAIAAGIAPAGLGSDTGGSVRIPAALCGICGLRPTTGRYPGDGVVPISHTRDTVGPMARTVADLALIDGVITGDEAGLERVAVSGLRLGVPRRYFHEPLETEVGEIFARALARLGDAGATLIEADIERIGELEEAVSFTIVLHEAARDLRRYLERSAPAVTLDALVQDIATPQVKQTYLGIVTGDPVSEAAYRQALEVDRPRLQQAIRAYFERHRLDAYLVPTTCLSARPIADDDTVDLNGERVPTFPTYIRNADPSSNAGIPSVTIPAGMTRACLPVGIMLEGPAGADRRLLAMAASLEQLLDPLPEPGGKATLT
jgi:mandelamide amidase